ncbi:MAG: tetratricopeptide repeat protein, partial [Candidatus Marinimicrobia bacterium]|nr:tetratricopeptide repeat protein [Candidatus Neomarinimicrobiota bacterium]
MKCKLRYKMRIIFLFSFTIIFAQSQNFDLVENRSEIALQHFMEGEFLLNQGNYAMAILEFQEAVEADPDGATIHVSIADAFRRLGKIRRAEKHLHIAIEIEPLDKEAYEMLGLLYLLEKKYDLAEKQFKALVELDPDFSDYYFSLGDIYRLKNEKVKAIEYYLKTYEANSLATNAL